MRGFAATLALILIPGYTFGQSDCVDGMAIIRLVSSQSVSTSQLTATPPLFGVTSVDEVLAQYAPTAIVPSLSSVVGTAQSSAVDRLSRTYVVYYLDSENPHTVVAELLSCPAVEAAFVNKRIVKHYAGTKQSALMKPHVVGAVGTTPHGQVSLPFAVLTNPSAKLVPPAQSMTSISPDAAPGSGRTG